MRRGVEICERVGNDGRAVKVFGHLLVEAPWDGEALLLTREVWWIRP